ncbi:WD repeat-containing protein [Schistosoma japonicum]|uniref:WD repeat-containing protein n=1 Tax=Schistosoma japonicum TaxID=6182 RepID=A0A4Z2D0H5_SCHJA|nr:WD repeat-containing protein [Schistosoma japonicum]
MKKLFTAGINLQSNNQKPFELQSFRSSFVAAFGFNQSVDIFDRHGEKKLEIPLPGDAVFMSWDTDGEILAIIDDKTSSVTLWDSVSSKISQLHTGMKDNLTVLSWSKVGNRLAIGTSKGNLVLYNHKTLKKTSLLGKHTRKVTCSVWNRNNIMALASEDKSITINSVEGDLIKQIIIHDQPSGLSFGQMKLHDISVAQDNTVSCIIGKKKLFLLNLDDMENPLELAFRRMYGDLIAYNWFGDGYIMVGFSNGYFVVISTQSSEIGKEIYQIRDFKDGLHDISVSAILNRCATVGDRFVKVHDLQNICELTAIIELEEEEMVENNSNNLNTKSINSNLFKYHIQWSSDGQLLAICTPQKHLHVFLSQLPLLAALAPPNSTGLLARLTSLLEITVEPIPYAKQIINLPPIYRSSYSLKTEVEPTFIGLGQKYLSVGINNHVWFYELTKSDIAFTTEYDYLTTVDQISLNENYAAACGPDGKLTLHWINPKSIPDKSNTTKKQIQLNTVQRNDTNQLSRESCIFPQSTTFDLKITSFKLTNDFLIYSTNRGELFHFYISDWNYANEYHHNCAILHIFPNATGTRVAFIDEKALAFIYNPANDQLIEIPEFCPSINNILWDLEDIENPLLIAYDNLQINVYRYYMNECVLTNSLVPTEKSGNMLKTPIQQITDDNQKCSTTTDKSTSRSNSGTFGTNHGLDSNKSPTRVIFGNCHLVGIARLPNGHLPLCITNGELCMLSPTGRLLTQPLTTHQFRVYTVQIHPTTGQNIFNEQNDISKDDSTEKSLESTGLTRLSYPEMVTYFEQALKAGCFEDAELFARQLNSHQLWSQLGMSCLRKMKFDIAIRCFRSIQDPSHISAIQRIQKIEDRYLIAGYVAMVLKEFDKAQELFLVSSEPIAALEMRRDLLHWEDALQLARNLAPYEIPFICREYAMEMECTGDYVNALMYYERALNVSDDNNEFKALKYSKEYLPPPQRLDCNEDKWSEHVSLCNAGIARNAIRLGDCKRGIKLASTTGNSNLQKECADILEECKQWQEAASLYELAGCYESAVIVSLKCKNYKKVGELLIHVTNAPRLHLQYAKAREADGAYKEAVSAYETAQDLDSVIRLQLEKLNNPNEAIRILNMSHSIEGAKMIAQYFIRTDDPAKAIRFLVMSQCFDAAFDLARKHKKMELYAEVIGYNASVSEYQSIACYFENEKNWYLAGKYYLLAKQYEKAVKHLLHVPYKENSPALDLALEAVGQAGDSRLTHLVIIYLMGETDGVVKDARHLFRLYMVLKQYKEAARTAVIIARDEQTNGNYRSAHDLLFSMVQELRQRNIHVPFEMSENLALLHSYILAKVHVKNGEHLHGARMLIRVSESISKFPAL